MKVICNKAKTKWCPYKRCKHAAPHDLLHMCKTCPTCHGNSKPVKCVKVAR
jgi:hypothetical protein